MTYFQLFQLLHRHKASNSFCEDPHQRIEGTVTTRYRRVQFLLITVNFWPFFKHQAISVLSTIFPPFFLHPSKKVFPRSRYSIYSSGLSRDPNYWGIGFSPTTELFMGESHNKSVGTICNISDFQVGDLVQVMRKISIVVTKKQSATVIIRILEQFLEAVPH